MNKTLPLFAALCLGGILASGTASAVPVSSYYYTTNTSQTVTNNVFSSWKGFTFDQFNVVDGIKGGYMDLLGITVSVDYSYLIGQTTVNNTDSTPSELTIDGYSSKLGVRTNSLGYSAFTNTIASVATSPDWAGTASTPIDQGQSIVLSLSPNQYFVTPGAPNVQSIANSYFSAYTGVGTVSFFLRDQQLVTGTGALYTVDASQAGAFTSMTVTYIYGVPEPSTYALFGLGGFALLLAYRRRLTA